MNRLIRRLYSVDVKFSTEWIRNMQKLASKYEGKKWSNFSKHVNRHIIPDADRKDRKAAVLVPICNKNGVGAILFTLRSQIVGSHKVNLSQYFFFLFK